MDLSPVILIALVQPLSCVGPHQYGPCGGFDCCASSPWQQRSGFLFLLHIKRVKHTVSPTPHPPISLWVRSKTSPVVFQQNLQVFFHSFPLFYVLSAPPPSLSLSTTSGQLGQSFLCDWQSKQRKSKQAETAKPSSWTNAWWTLPALSADKDHI